MAFDATVSQLFYSVYLAGFLDCCLSKTVLKPYTISDKLIHIVAKMCVCVCVRAHLCN